VSDTIKLALFSTTCQMTCQKVGVAEYVVACVIYNRLSAPFPESGQR